MLDAAKYAKKAAILNQILLNYGHEEQAILKKNAALFRHVLQERKQLIDELRDVQIGPPTSALLRLQQQNINRLVQKIQFKREQTDGLFPH